MEVLVSIIVPAYNIEQYIEQSLRSICEQTYRNLEIIVVDDGSTDETGKIIDEAAAKDSRIIPIHKKNAGVSAARNTGLAIAKGEYIGFVDGDDFVDKDMYELLVRNAIKYDADISHCGYQMVFPDRVDYYYNTGELRIQDQYQGVYDLIKADKVEPGLCNKIYRNSIVSSKQLDEIIKINEDLLFNYHLFKSAKKSVFEDVPKYSYMVRRGSASTSGINRNKIEDPVLVIEKMMKEETGEILQLLKKRYVYLLEKISVLVLEDPELLKYQKQKRGELKKILKQGLEEEYYSKKDVLQLKLAVKNPMAYRCVHGIYALATGSRNKYRIS